MPRATSTCARLAPSDLSDAAQKTIFEELEGRLAGREAQVHGLTLPATEGEGTPYAMNGEAGHKPGFPVANGIHLPVQHAATAAAALAAIGPVADAALANADGPADLAQLGAELLAAYLAMSHAIM